MSSLADRMKKAQQINQQSLQNLSTSQSSAPAQQESRRSEFGASANSSLEQRMRIMDQANQLSLANFSERRSPRAQSPYRRAQLPDGRAQSPDRRAQSPDRRAQSPDRRAQVQSQPNNIDQFISPPLAPPPPPPPAFALAPPPPLAPTLPSFSAPPAAAAAAAAASDSDSQTSIFAHGLSRLRRVVTNEEAKPKLKSKEEIFAESARANSALGLDQADKEAEERAVKLEHIRQQKKAEEERRRQETAKAAKGLVYVKNPAGQWEVAKEQMKYLKYKTKYLNLKKQLE
jgi:hypothetical protein